MLGCVLTDCRDSCLSFMVMCHTLHDVCLHVGLLLVRTALATTLYATSRISTAFTQASPTMINHLSSYTTHTTPGGRVTMAPGFTGCRTYHLPLLRFTCTPLSSPCPVCQGLPQLPGAALPPCDDHCYWLVSEPSNHSVW